MSDKKQAKKSVAPRPTSAKPPGAGAAPKKPAAAPAAPKKSAREAKAASILEEVDSTEKPKTGKMRDREILLAAIEHFLTDNSNFESSVALADAMKDIEDCKTCNEVFTAALKNKALNLDGALRFILFLAIATREPLKDEESGDEDPPIPAEARFGCEDALKLVESCFDTGTQNAVWDYVDKALEGESDDEDEGDEAGGDAHAEEQIDS